MKYDDALVVAANLMSEHGENPEYDRALVELLSDLFGDHRENVLGDLRTVIAEGVT